MTEETKKPVFTNLQKNTVKSIARSLTPLERKWDKLQEKKKEYLTNIEKTELELSEEMQKVRSSILTFTGGYTLEEVLEVPVELSVVEESSEVEVLEVKADVELEKEDAAELDLEPIAEIVTTSEVDDLPFPLV